MTKTKTPVWSYHLDEQGRAEIENAVARAEKNTSGEIVPMVVRSSSATGHVHITVLLILIVLALLVNMALQYFMPLPNWIFLVEILAIEVLRRVWGSSPTVHRWLTPTHDLALQVERRAHAEFLDLGLDKTKGSTGILLFVSLHERWAVVLADQAIAQKLSPETWRDVIHRMLDGIKTKNLSHGFVDAIEHCGEILAKDFPAGPNDKNELPNQLILKE